MDTVFYPRFLSRLATFVVLAVISGIMAGMLAAGLLYASYRFLIAYGLAPDAALVAVGILAAVILAVCAALTLRAMKNLRRTFRPLSSIASGAGEIADAFVSGLLTPPIPRNPN